jgi:hypothetical protein
VSGYVYREQVFLSTLPRGERPETGTDKTGRKTFLSTLPRGERRARRLDRGAAHAVSIHAPARGARFLDDGRLCMSNNAAERVLRCVAVGRNNWTFAGSDEGGRRAAALYTLIETAKLNDIDPRAWLADVLARLPDHPARRICELLPWNWKTKIVTAAAA